MIFRVDPYKSGPGILRRKNRHQHSVRRKERTGWSKAELRRHHSPGPQVCLHGLCDSRADATGQGRLERWRVPPSVNRSRCKVAGANCCAPTAAGELHSTCPRPRLHFRWPLICIRLDRCMEYVLAARPKADIRERQQSARSGRRGSTKPGTIQSVTLITSKSVPGDALEITGLFEKNAQFL